MAQVTTLIPDLRRLLGDEMELVWDDAILETALIFAQVEYLRRSRSKRLWMEIEVADSDYNVELPEESVRVEYCYNSRELKVRQTDFYSANRLDGGKLETELGIPEYLYESKEFQGYLKTYPNCDGTLEIYDNSTDFGLTLSIEDYDYDYADEFGVVFDGFGVIEVFREFTGEKVYVSVSLKPEVSTIYVRFPEALPWRAAADLLEERKETEDFGRAGLFNQMFNKYVKDDIRLLKRRIGEKSYGGTY